MHVLVTGACGYIGSALVPQLQATPAVDAITVLDSLIDGSPGNLLGARIDDRVSFIRGDIREAEDVSQAMETVDVVIHLAAITGAESTHDRAAETHAVNVGGTQTVLAAASDHDVDRVILASSCNVYGRAAATNIDETTSPNPINPYAESKLQAETLLADATTETDLTGTALRLSTVYGDAPGIRFNLVVNHFVFRALTGRPLTVYGDGSNWRPFIHVDDAARAFIAAALNPTDWTHPAYNVGANDENYRIDEIADVVREVVDPSLEVTYLEDKQPGPSYHVNFDRVQTTGYSPTHSLSEGIAELAERFKSETDRQLSLSPTRGGR